MEANTMEAIRERSENTYVISGRTLSGTPEEMLAQIDEAVAALLAFRQLIATTTTRPAERQKGGPKA